MTFSARNSVLLFVVFLITLMQGGVIFELVFGKGARNAVIAASVISILIGVVFASFSCRFKNNGLFLFVASLIIFCIFELIIVLRQPQMLEFFSLAQRYICYFLFLAPAFLVDKDSNFSFGNGAKIYVRFSVYVLLLLAVMFFLKIDDVKSYAIGRVTLSDSVSAVGLGFSLCLLAVIALTLALSKNTNNFEKAVLAFSVMILITGAVSTGSRGPLIALLVCSVFLFIWSEVGREGKLKALLSLLLIVFIVIFYVSNDDFYRDQLENLLNRFGGLINYGVEDTSVSARAVIISGYLGAHGGYFLLGVDGYSGLYPHNLFLDFLVRYGVLGACFATFVYGFSLIQLLSRRNRKLAIAEKVLLSVLLYSFIVSQVSLTFEFMRFYWFSLGYFVFRRV